MCWQDPYGFQPPKLVQEFVVPYTKPGTPLYFNFSAPSGAAGLLSFALVGDLYWGSAVGGVGAALTAEERQRLARARDAHVPLGALGLTGKIRLFRFVKTVDLGPLAQLSII